MTAKTNLALILTITLAAPLAAQDAAIDLDADGMYSYPELVTAMPEMSEDDFTVLDLNGDGLLDADEIAAAMEAGGIPASEG